MKPSKLKQAQRSLAKFERKLAKLLNPRWLRKLFKRTSKALQKAESGIARSTRRATKSVAKSPVGKGVQDAQRFGRRFQHAVVVFSVTLWKIVVGIASFLVPNSLRSFFWAARNWIGTRLGTWFQFMTRWFRTRNYRLLIGGVPALALSGILAFFMIQIPLNGTQAKISQYEAAANNAISNNDLKAIALYHRRLGQLGGMRELSAFKAALFAFDQGDRRMAIEQMQKLAPLTGPIGYGPAHSAMARWILAGEISLPDDQKHELAEAHINRAIARNENDPIARLARAELYKRTGRIHYAISDMEHVQRTIPSLGLGLVELHLLDGKPEKAMEAVRNVDQFYAARKERGAELDSMGFIYWAQAKMMLGEMGEAERLYAEGMEQYRDDEAFREQAVTFFSIMADLTRGPTKSSAARSLSHIRRGLSLDKDNRELLDKIVAMAGGTDEAADVATKELESLQAMGEAPTILPSMLGTLAAEKGEFKKALPLLLKGASDNPADALTLNNAAWVQLQIELRKPPSQRNELPNALAMVEQALRLEPDRAIFHETKGQILLACGNPESAIVEFEISLNALDQPDPGIHEALAKAYTELNNSDVAQIHRNTARRLRGQRIP